MIKIRNILATVVLLILATTSCAYPAPCTIVVGSSLASNHWPKVLNQDGTENSNSRNPLIKGNYKGFCNLLSREFSKRLISCPAEALAMSTDFELTLMDKSTIKASGYLKQFDKGVHECTWNGTLLADSLIISLVNDGPASIPETKRLIDKAKSLGIANIIVQAFPSMPNYELEKSVAITKHGDYWGGVLQLLLATPPTQDQFNQLKDYHKSELEFYPGVTSYFDFYKNDYVTIDGAHPILRSQRLAVQEILYKLYE